MESCNQGEVLVGNFICVSESPAGFAGAIYAIGLSIAGALAVLFFVYGAYVIMMSRGNPSDLQKGKSYIFYALAGLLLAIFGYVFAEIVFIDILQLPGFTR